MGKAKIISNLGSGQYTVKLDLNMDVLEVEYRRILSDIDTIIEKTRPELEERRLALEDLVAQDKENINGVIDALTSLLQQGIPGADVDGILAAIHDVQLLIDANETALNNEQQNLRDIENQLRRDDLTISQRHGYELDRLASQDQIGLISQLLKDQRKHKRDLQNSFDVNPVITTEMKRLTDLSKKYQTDLTNHLSEFSLVERQLEEIKFKLADFAERLLLIDDLRRDEKEVDLWCADRSESLTDYVGTIEVPGENTRQLIAPGYTDLAKFNDSQHGLLTPTAAMSPEAYFYNLAMMPAWQTFRPTYRLAKITKDNGDGSFKVTLIEPNKSSQLAEDSYNEYIDITPKEIEDVNRALKHYTTAKAELDTVPVVYMGCHGAAFSVDDKVLVQYYEQDATKPVIVGFADHPKSCSAEFAIYSPSTTTGRMSYGGHNWTHESATFPELLYGNFDYRVGGSVISWHGPWGRNIRIAWRNAALDQDRKGNLSNKIYRNGLLYATAPGLVLGVSETSGGDINRLTTSRYLVVVTTSMATDASTSDKDEFWFYPLTSPVEDRVWEKVGEYPYPSDGATDGVYSSAGGQWLFNDTGNRAVSNKMAGFAASARRSRILHLDFHAAPPENVSGVSATDITASDYPIPTGNYDINVTDHIVEYRGDALVGMSARMRQTGTFPDLTITMSVTLDGITRELLNIEDHDVSSLDLNQRNFHKHNVAYCSVRDHVILATVSPSNVITEGRTVISYPGDSKTYLRLYSRNANVDIHSWTLGADGFNGPTGPLDFQVTGDLAYSLAPNTFDNVPTHEAYTGLSLRETSIQYSMIGSNVSMLIDMDVATLRTTVGFYEIYREQLYLSSPSGASGVKNGPWYPVGLI